MQFGSDMHVCRRYAQLPYSDAWRAMGNCCHPPLPRVLGDLPPPAIGSPTAQDHPASKRDVQRCLTTRRCCARVGAGAAKRIAAATHCCPDRRTHKVPRPAWTTHCPAGHRLRIPRTGALRPHYCEPSGGGGGTSGGRILFNTATPPELRDCNHSKAPRGIWGPGPAAAEPPPPPIRTLSSGKKRNTLKEPKMGGRLQVHKLFLSV